MSLRAHPPSARQLTQKTAEQAEAGLQMKRSHNKAQNVSLRQLSIKFNQEGPAHMIRLG